MNSIIGRKYDDYNWIIKTFYYTCLTEPQAAVILFHLEYIFCIGFVQADCSMLYIHMPQLDVYVHIQYAGCKLNYIILVQYIHLLVSRISSLKKDSSIPPLFGSESCGTVYAYMKAISMERFQIYQQGMSNAWERDRYSD